VAKKAEMRVTKNDVRTCRGGALSFAPVMPVQKEEGKKEGEEKEEE
jgi:hypothetical protein